MKQICKNSQSLWRVFAKFCDENGEEFEKPQLVEIRDYVPTRSLPQNARLHCMIRNLSQHTGHSESELKSYFKAEFGPTKRLQVGSEGRVIPLSTTQYTRKQMAEMIEHVDRVCAENNVYEEII